MKVLNQADRPLLITVGIMLVFGLVMLSSASSVFGFDRFEDSYYYIKRQILFGLLPGLLIGYIIMKGGYKLIERFSLPIFVVGIILLVLVFIPGIGQSYDTFAHRWIKLGPIRFQPSELVKLTTVAYLAAWLSSRGRNLNDFKTGFMPFAAIVGLVAGLIILEPDMGTTGVIVITSFLMYFIANGSFRYIALLVAAGASALGVLILAEPYRLDRLKIFLDPSADPQGIGYHVQQSFLAIGSGGLWGRGFGQSRAKFQYLPEVTGDSIFPIIAEELGFFFSAALVLLFLYFFWRVMKVAEQADNPFARYLVAGIGIWICVQAFINLASMVGLIPLTGVPLPFVSYGGTSLMAVLIGVSIILSVSAEQTERGR